MGCVLGSFGFDIVAQKIYEKAMTMVEGTITKALTDDNASGVPPQDEHVDGMSEQVRLCGEIFRVTRHEAMEIAGLSVNMSKTAILLPLDAQGNTVNLEEFQRPPNLPSDLKIVTHGIKLAGAPIGTDDFVRDYTRECLTHFEKRLFALPGIDPQVGFGLLRSCVASAPTFLTQVTPPLLTADLFEEFDEKMVDCAMQLIRLPGQDPPECSKERIQRATLRLQLPLRHKGAGVTSVARRHAATFYASVISSAATCDELYWNIDGLSDYAADTHARILAKLGPASQKTASVEDIVCRRDSLAMLNVPYFADMFVEEDPKLNRQLSGTIHAVAAHSLEQDLLGRATDTCGESDLVAASTKGDLELVLTAKLSNKYNRLSGEDFVTWLRMFLQLPPLQKFGNAEPREGYDYEMEECLGDHAEGEHALLDMYGSHDNSNCAPTSQGKHSGHNWLKWTIYRFARRVEGVDAKVEPKTHEILLNQFSESRCRKLFPKRPSKQRSEAVRSIIDDLDRAKRLTVVSERTEALREVSRRMDELNIRNATEEKKAVRLDLHLRKGLDELLIDTTCTHPMTKAGRQPEIKRTWERILSDVKEVKDKPAAAVDAARAKKFQTYNPLLYVIKKQVLDGRRQREPKFTPAVLTTFGERGPGVVLIQEWLAMRYKATLERREATLGPRPDGFRTAGMVGKFRAEFRMALRMVAVRRMGALQRASGLPKECTRKDAERDVDSFDALGLE
jgi:hypothetical protein